MPRIGITGHSNLTAACVPIIRKALEAELAAYPGRGRLAQPCAEREQAG